MNAQQPIEAYSPAYCAMLEMAYGQGLMSEGGTNAIDELFVNLDLHGKTMLDIGFGLGGSMQHLARRYKAQITGLDINPHLLTAASSRVSPDLRQQLTFQCYNPSEPLELSDSSFDLVYSKGSLVHCQNKTLLFNEIYRILKPGGYFVINDWLSPTKSSWGFKVKTLCETEQLTLYAETIAGYYDLLEQAGFILHACFDQNEKYALYNADVTKHLQHASIAQVCRAAPDALRPS